MADTWTQTIRNTFLQNKTTKTAIVQRNLADISGNIATFNASIQTLNALGAGVDVNANPQARAAVAAASTAQTAAAAAIQQIDPALQALRTDANSIAQISDGLLTAQQNLRNSIETNGAGLVPKRADVQQAKTLETLRKEQAETLKTKYGGYSHTAWFGPWRPLSEQSRTVLLALVVFFALIVGMSVYYLFRTGFFVFPAVLGGGVATAAAKAPVPAPPVTESSGLNGALNNLFGGGGSRRHRK